MPFVMHVPDLRAGYVHVANEVLRLGKRTAPRGQATYEILDAIIVLEDPTDALPIGVGRKLNTAIGIVEAVQLIAGVADAALTTRIAPNMTQFMNGNIFHGAYGQRISTQMDAVEAKLREDPDSRQAIVTLWNPVLDNTPGMQDYPCTVMMQFMIRNDRLIMHTTMRSNDVWWGLAYDAFQFTQLQLTLARVLDIKPGPYHHHAVSLHVYERDVQNIIAMRPPAEDGRPEPFLGIGDQPLTMESMRQRAHMVMQGYHPPFATETEERFIRALHERGRMVTRDQEEDAEEEGTFDQG